MQYCPRVSSSLPTFAMLMVVIVAVGLGLVDVRAGQGTPAAPRQKAGDGARAHANVQLFQTSDSCVACHNGLTTSSGEDVSIGSEWRASIMANASRDPYWQAGVRRETLDHPEAAADIQDECSICHMPMSRTQARASGRKGQVFAHLPVSSHTTPEDLLAHDGVSCTVCHQIADQKLGTRDSFTGGYVVDTAQAAMRSAFGPFKIDKGRTTIMLSSSGFQPTEAAHIRQSELCATCHTLITKALGPGGEVIGTLPEQVMYLEWRHSAFQAEEKSCQSCHMPVVQEQTPISSVFGEPRDGFSRHVFVGGNFFVLRMLNRYRVELGVTALPLELDASVRRTIENLQTATAAVRLERAALVDGQIEIDVAVQNQTGHKLPTAYPSRRAWLHLTVRDRNGRPVFESGKLQASGLIDGNDNDAEPTRFERHYTEIRQADQVQIYESIMGDSRGTPTTGLLIATGYLKDNRLLPRGFDKASAESDIRVVGDATQDADFVGGSDHVRYSADMAGAEGPFQVDVELRFQPVGYRWTQNLKPYDSVESRRFVTYYESMSAASAETLARVTQTVR